MSLEFVVASVVPDVNQAVSEEFVGISLKIASMSSEEDQTTLMCAGRLIVKSSSSLCRP